MLVALLVACLILTGLYGSVCIFAVQQTIRVYLQDELSCASYKCWFPRTIQRQVQILVVFLTALRAAFFLVAIFAWDASMGEVDRYRGAFYSLDELSTIAFFSLTCVLALFWAEVYYIAIDQVTEYRYLIRPMTYAINVGAYIAVIGCAYAAVHASSDTSSYIYWNFSLLISALFILAALVFTFFAYKAATEISAIPVHMATRQERTEELSRIFTIFILALLARAACLLLMSNDALDTDTTAGIVLLSIYFILLELVPTIFAIVFYRTQGDENSNGVATYGHKIRFEDVVASMEEVQPLQGFSNQESSYTSSGSSKRVKNNNSNSGSVTSTKGSVSENLKEQEHLSTVANLLKRLNTTTTTPAAASNNSNSQNSSNSSRIHDNAA